MNMHMFHNDSACLVTFLADLGDFLLSSILLESAGLGTVVLIQHVAAIENKHVRIVQRRFCNVHNRNDVSSSSLANLAQDRVLTTRRRLVRVDLDFLETRSDT